MLILAAKPGQLANRLSILSHFIAFSLEYDVPVLCHAFDEYADFFEGPLKGMKIKEKSVYHFFDKSDFARHQLFEFFRISAKIMRKSNINDLVLIKNLHLKNDEELFLMNDETNLPELTSKKLFFLSGWLFRTQGLVEKHLDFITSYFKPLKTFRDSAENTVLPLKNDFKTVVGIHIRRGDYKNFLGGKYFYELEAYKSVMNRIADIFGKEKTAFVICSNEEIDLSDFNGLNVFKGPGHFVADLHALSLCDYIAGPPSTFSMWASFYGQKPLWQIKNVKQNPTVESFETTEI